MHHCERLTAVDFSAGMLSVARDKAGERNVNFQQANLPERWPFQQEQFDLVVFSLVLEHIQDLYGVFYEGSRVLAVAGIIVYLGVFCHA